MEKEFKNKNDYACIFFFPNRKPLKLAFVHNLYKASIWVEKTAGEYSYFNCYARRTGRFLKRIYKNAGFIPPRLV